MLVKNHTLKILFCLFVEEESLFKMRVKKKRKKVELIISIKDRYGILI